ncbi:hypothetical protein B0H13DRAFT_2382340 [Mycena leptocephala]|nr:hypothetical protein B0H13DRAFT_2382340 [Mycena leptocephala]
MSKSKGSRRKREYKPVAKEDRKSLKAWAKGAREKILEPHIAGYTNALERDWRAERDYLQDVCNEYHALIPWHLDDYEEPEEPLPVWDKFAPVVAEELDEDETVRKRKRRIARWLKYRARRLRRSVHMDPRKDPFAILVSKLARYKLAAESQASVSATRWEQERNDLDGQGSLATQKGPNAPFRAKVARELFAELSEEERAALKERAQLEAKEAKEAYDKARRSPASKSPEDRQRCIDALGAFMTPILRGIQEYTGLHSVVLLGGPIPKYGGELRTVQVAYGRCRDGDPATFPQWCKHRFNKEVVGLMKEYLPHAFSAVECAEAALPDQSGLLGGAKYTFDDDVVLSEDESDSDDSGSDSDSDSDSAEESSKKKSKQREVAKKNKEKKKSDGTGQAKAWWDRCEKKAATEDDSEPNADSNDEPEGNDWEEELTFDQRRQRNINQRREQLRVLDEACAGKAHPQGQGEDGPRGAGEALSAAGSDVRQRDSNRSRPGGPTSSGDAAPASHLAVNTTSDSGAAPPSNPAPNGGAAAANLAPNGGAAAANPARTEALRLSILPPTVGSHLPQLRP